MLKRKFTPFFAMAIMACFLTLTGCSKKSNSAQNKSGTSFNQETMDRSLSIQERKVKRRIKKQRRKARREMRRRAKRNRPR